MTTPTPRIPPNPRTERPIPKHYSARKRLEWVLYRHGLRFTDDGRAICDCGEWRVLTDSGTWEEHLADVIQGTVLVSLRSDR